MHGSEGVIRLYFVKKEGKVRSEMEICAAAIRDSKCVAVGKRSTRAINYVEKP